MVPITDAELNYIIFRYFMESGFTHAAFMFDCEARIGNSPVKGNLIPHAALSQLVHKGLQYMETEEYLKKGVYDVDKDFSFLQAMDLIKKEESKVQKIVTDKKKNQRPTITVKLSKEGKARKAHERKEADKKAREKEKAYREARQKEEADRVAQKKEEADRVARERDELDRAERRLSRIRIKRKKVTHWND